MGAGIINEADTSTDSLHLALMRHCLRLTLQCPVSPTAFCVGSTLFLPFSSPLFDTLRYHFTPFSSEESSSVEGLILSDGYSRQIPGNTHAEANALENFRTCFADLSKTTELPKLDEILKELDCYATMEPCSIRTSGGPSCALELVRSKVKTVYLVSIPTYRSGTELIRIGSRRTS